jgi:hypothetical protein
MNVIDSKMLSMMFFRHHAHAATTRPLTILFVLVVGFSAFAAFGRRGRPDGRRNAFAPHAAEPSPDRNVGRRFQAHIENACALM